VLSTVARLVRHTDTRSFFSFFLLAVSFRRCVVYRECPRCSRAFSPRLILLFIARVLTSCEDSHSSPVFSPYLVVQRQDSHSSRASSSHLISRKDPHLTLLFIASILTFSRAPPPRLLPPENPHLTLFFIARVLISRDDPHLETYKRKRAAAAR